jgi:hypothetical protein
MFKVIKQGEPVPPKVWRQVTDLLIEYRQAGEAWAAAGRPIEGPLAEAHNTAETAYVEATEAIWHGKWSLEQRAEWSRLWSESPYGIQGVVKPEGVHQEEIKIAL